jgi:hypothetical protein
VRSLLVAGIAGTVCVAGCSLLVPLDATSGGPEEPDANTTEGGGAVDAPVGDAREDRDAVSPVASDAMVPDAALVCFDGALVCDRFERDGAGGEGWSAFGNVQTSTTKSFSPTRSLSLEVDTNDGLYPNLARDLTGSTAHIHVAFRLFTGTPPADYVEIVKIPYGGLNQWDTATIAMDGQGLRAGLQTYTGSSSPANAKEDSVTTAAIFDQAWHYVEMDIDMRAATKVFTMTVDASTAKSIQITGHPTAQTPVQVMIGILFRGGPGAVSGFYLDDFLITAL